MFMNQYMFHKQEATIHAHTKKLKQHTQHAVGRQIAVQHHLKDQ